MPTRLLAAFAAYGCIIALAWFTLEDTRIRAATVLLLVALAIKTAITTRRQPD